MSSNRFLMSVAAIALIAGAGAANAQGMNRESGGAAMQHGAPSGTAATPAGHDSAQPSGGSSEMKSEQSAPGAAKGQRAEESAPGQKSKGMSSQNETKGNETKGGKDMKAETREGQSGNMKAETREGRDNKMNAEGREDRNSKMNAETKTGTDRSQVTTGQAGAGAKLSTEQRTKITTVIRSEHVAPSNNVNFSIAVGTRVPRESVTFRPLPAEVVTIYPEWRGYEFFLVRDQIIVVDPRTLEIVAVLDA
jgi:hypothetical protein